MGLKKFEKDMNIIAALDDEPNDVGGLSASQLKEKFDQSGCEIKQYINETLLPALEAETAAASLGVRMPSSSGSEGPGTIQEAIDSLSAVAMNGGAVPAGGQTGQILAKSDAEDHRLKWIDADAEVFGSYPKEKILSAATAALFGLTADAVPDDALIAIKASIDNGVKIQVGTYVGTGVAGPNYKSSLTLNFVPKFILIMPNTTTYDDVEQYEGFFFIDNENCIARYASDSPGSSSGFTLQNKIEVVGNTVSWCVSDTTDYTIWSSVARSYISIQLNAPTVTYNYVAIG